MSKDLFSLDGDVAIVTGAGRGIGSGMGRVLSQAGASVVCAARRTHEIEQVAREISEAGTARPRQRSAAGIRTHGGDDGGHEPE